MRTLTTVKVILEIILLAAFLLLLVHVLRNDGKHAALSLLTNKP